MHARLFYGNSIKTEGRPSHVVDIQDDKPSFPAELPVIKTSEEGHGKAKDPDDINLVFSSFEEARARGLSYGSGYRAKTSKANKEWRYYCKVVSCSAKWSIREKTYTGRSMLFILLT